MTELFARKEARRRQIGVDERDNGCLCQRCDKRYKVDFMVPDALWAQIHNGYNLLCGSCIVALIEDRGTFDCFDVNETR